MRRHHTVDRQVRPALGQQVQRIGIPDLRHCGIRRDRQQAAAPGGLPEPRPDHQHAGLLKRCHQLIGRLDTQHHHFRQTRQRCGHMLGTRGQ